MANKPAAGFDSWRCWIPGEPWPPLNFIYTAHWSKVRRFKRGIMQLVHAYGERPLPAFDGPVRVQVTRWIGKGGRELDHENLFGGAKPIIDALRRDDGTDRRGRRRGGGIGIIEDDKPRLLELHVLEHRAGRGEPGGIEIQVEGRKAGRTP